MAKTNKRHIRANSNDKLKALRDQLRMCTVVLHNVALDKDLVRLYHSAFSGKKKKLEHTTPCINASENSNNVWMLKENVHEDNMQDEIPRVTRNRLKKLTKKEMEECKDVELSDNLLYNQFYKMVKPEFLAQKRQVKCDDSIKSFSSKSNDDISSMSSNTYCSHTQKKTVPSNSQKPLIKSNSNKRLSVQKINKIKGNRKLQLNKLGISMKSIKINSDDENYLNKKNLTSTDVSNKMQEVSDEFVKKYNSNNLCTVGVTNGTICRVRLEHCLERNQNSKSINTMETAGLNIAEKNNVELDLRKHLNKKRSKQSPKQLTFEHKLNNNSIDPKPINLNNKKDDKKITPISTTKNEKFRKRLFFETEPILDKTLLVKEKTLPDEEKDIQVDLVCNNYTHSHSASPLSTSEETQHLSQIDKNIGENINVQEKHTNSKNEDDYDDDCISLFAESFDTNLCETTFLNEQDKSNKSLHSDAPYIMTTSSFNKFVKQNATEFNKEYAKYVESNIQTSNKTCETNREVNRQLRQTTDCMPETTLKVTSLETKKEEILKYPWSTKIDLKNMIVGYCFCILKKGICHKSIQCRFQHDLQTLIRTVCSEDPRAILDVIRNALHLGYNFFCRRIYLNSMAKLTIDQILIMYQMFHEIRPFYSKDEFTIAAKKYIIHDVINELLKRQLSLKTIVSQMIEYIMLTKDPINLMNMLVCIEQYVKHGEYWNTVKSLILRLPPDKFIIEKILRECIENENLIDVQDVNKNLINKVHPKLILQLDKNILERFKRLTEKVAKNSHSTLLIQNFGENLSETIASPDGNTNLSQTEFPRYDVTVANKIKDQETEVNGKTYILRPIDDLPEPRSIYRDHNHLWKFYVDLDRFKKGLSHQDYDYVIKILKKYAEKDENTFFVHSCCKILRTEVKRSEYHLANIIRRTGNKYFNTTQST